MLIPSTEICESVSHDYGEIFLVEEHWVGRWGNSLTTRDAFHQFLV